MRLAELAGYLGLLLALGVALDVALKPLVKRKAVILLRRMASTKRRNYFTGSNLLDRVFGERIMSWKAIIRYSLVSVVSISVSIIVAFISSPSHVRSHSAIFPTGVNGISIILILVCLVFCILSDIFSYAQTRIFVRTVDRYRNSAVSLGLSLADAVISLVLLFIIFSFSRLLCYLIVIQQGVQPIYTDRIVAQELVVDTIPRLINRDTVQETSLELQQAYLIGRASSESEVSRVQALIQSLQRRALVDPERYHAVSSTCRDFVQLQNIMPLTAQRS